MSSIMIFCKGMTLKCTCHYITLYIFDSMQNAWFVTYFCLLQTIHEGIVKASKNLDPYLLCIGTPAIISSCVVICNQKVVTEHISKNLLACLFVLLAIYYSYNEYNAEVKPALEFLQRNS